jgi:hypothetical protein
MAPAPHARTRGRHRESSKENAVDVEIELDIGAAPRFSEQGADQVLEFEAPMSDLGRAEA